MKAVFLTAGAAGMYCGSCMHDNELARAMGRIGVDCVLQPVYTPIRTDAESIANENVFFGGIHIYLLQQMPWLRFAPKPLMRALDWPPLIRWATKRSSSTNAAKLGELSVSMLKGADGRQAAEVDRIVKWLADEMKPDAIVLSNLLIGGALPAIRKALPDTRIAVILQGDDIFLEYLPEPSQGQAISLCRDLVPSVDVFVSHSRYYADKMSKMLAIPNEKLAITRLSIDTSPFNTPSTNANTDRFRLGYMARIAPEKGLHHLVAAFIQLASKDEHQDLELHIAGWLGEANHEYFQKLQNEISTAGLTSRFVYHGSPELAEKAAFLKSLNVLSVPTDYQEPKGLFVLEALASGVPVIQPDHGAFPELIDSTGGGLLFPAGDVAALCSSIEKLKSSSAERQSLAQKGKEKVEEVHTIEAAATEMRRLLLE